MSDDFKPVTSFDVSDENPAMIAGHVRALQREVRDGFASIGRAILPAIERLDAKLDVIIDRQNVIERRQDAHEARTASAIADLSARVAKLEDARPVGAPAPGTVTRRRRAPGRK